MAQRLMNPGFYATVVSTAVAGLFFCSFAAAQDVSPPNAAIEPGTVACAPDSNTSKTNPPEATENESNVQRFEFSATKMGVPVRICFYAPDAELAQKAAEAVLERFDQLNAILSDYDPESEIISVCRKSAETREFIPVSPDLYRVLAFSRSCTERTDGAFDITVSPIVKLWRRSRSFHKLPPAEYLEKAKQLVGNSRWELQTEPMAVRTLAPGVRFDVGGVAKGMALDDALDILHNFGITRAMLDAGGDLRLGDPPPEAEGWRIELADMPPESSESTERPEQTEPTGPTKRTIKLMANTGIACSGDTNRYVEIDNVRYSHLIDPRTGNPLTEHQIVTVAAPTAAEADALASAICVLGETEGRKILDNFPGACLIRFLR